jgi:hypothetical protein
MEAIEGTAYFQKRVETSSFARSIFLLVIILTPFYQCIIFLLSILVACETILRQRVLII